MIGREMPSKSQSSPVEPCAVSTGPTTFPTTNNNNNTNESAPTVVSQATTAAVPTNHQAIKTRTIINEPLLGPVTVTVTDDGDFDETQQSLLSLIDLEQAIEHVTELILNPSLLGGGGGGGSASNLAAGVHQHKGHHHNSHLLVDGKVQCGIQNSLSFSCLPDTLYRYCYSVSRFRSRANAKMRLPPCAAPHQYLVVLL